MRSIGNHVLPIYLHESLFFVVPLCNPVCLPRFVFHEYLTLNFYLSVRVKRNLRSHSLCSTHLFPLLFSRIWPWAEHITS